MTSIWGDVPDALREKMTSRRYSYERNLPKYYTSFYRHKWPGQSPQTHRRESSIHPLDQVLSQYPGETAALLSFPHTDLPMDTLTLVAQSFSDSCKIEIEIE